jgi:mono/diheme cytochrome c family protein
LGTSEGIRGMRGDAGMRNRRVSGTVILMMTVLLGSGCTVIDNALASVPVFAFMRNAPSFDPYEHPLPPPPGTVPFESPNGPVLPYLEASDAALNAWAAGPYGQNPYAADDAAVLATGRVMYERHCAVCHGATGQGNGPIQQFITLMPPLVSGNALTLSDGYVYGVIRAGRGLMPAYGPRMTHAERWAIVSYVNSLQVQAGAQQQPAAQDPAAAAGAGASPQLPQTQQQDTPRAQPPGAQ